jgi:D-alanine transaminase
MSTVIYVNGERREYDEAKIHVEDRGFQFGDSLYEIIRVYGGRFFYIHRHFARLKKGAVEIYLDIDFVMDRLESICRKATKETGCDEVSIYIQISRGMSPRQHAFPKNSSCNWVVIAREAKPYAKEFYENGVTAIMVPDERWTKCNIKTTQILLSSIAKEKARRAGAYEAIFHRGGCITEGSSSNAFIVKEGRLLTHPINNLILNGVTRSCVLEIAEQNGIRYSEEVFSLKDVFDSDEMFITGTLTEVMPVVKVDGKMIGDGIPGKITRTIMGKFEQLKKTVDS